MEHEVKKNGIYLKGEKENAFSPYGDKFLFGPWEEFREKR